MNTFNSKSEKIPSLLRNVYLNEDPFDKMVRKGLYTNEDLMSKMLRKITPETRRNRRQKREEKEKLKGIISPDKINNNYSKLPLVNGIPLISGDEIKNPYSNYSPPKEEKSSMETIEIGKEDIESFSSILCYPQSSTSLFRGGQVYNALSVEQKQIIDNIHQSGKNAKVMIIITDS